MLLYQEELCVCELSGILEAPQPRISKSLSKLRDLNLVVVERKEKFVYYSLKIENKVLIDTIKNIVGDIDNYPQFVSDRSKLKVKEKYLSKCCTRCD
jgi:ArsR family transcriptional regulator